ncbi:MAG: glucosamine-6-phosphate deaminase [Tenericutes bacterium HGW-Tenericutes-8]|nr:MAG: glucosamine-6-phosphate deaminase [Tenericutes bacterium HGW-Tenericutes-8]
MNIHIYNSKSQIDQAVAKLLIDQVLENPKCTLGLATGSTPIGIYQLLVKDHLKNQTNYEQVTTVNLDEYIGLPKTHGESYYNFMHRNLFSYINIQKDNIYLPDGLTDDLQLACENYNRVLSQFVPDIQILGIGTNGHIGFNEPNTPFDSKTHIIELAEKTRKDNARFFNTMDEVPTHAITMGIQNIMDAKKIILVATGKQKASAVKAMISGPVNESIPASILQKHNNVEIFLDKEAASLLL